MAPVLARPLGPQALPLVLARPLGTGSLPLIEAQGHAETA